ncbi:MAG TPA: replicative DNA helicase [Bacillota bacterium]|mgnify:CR=1 FL=1|nr:replicative DNA helicase [Bacillota bacterium]
MANHDENQLGMNNTPPSNVQSERAVLCCCLNDMKAISTATQILEKDDFYHPANGIIFETITEMSIVKADAIDLITLSDALETKGLLEKVGGITYLSTITDLSFNISLTNIQSYATTVKYKSMLRKLILITDEIRRKAYEGDINANDLIDLLMGRLSKLRENPSGIGFENLHDILQKSLLEIKQIQAGTLKRNAVMSGFPALDHVTKGFRPGSLIIIAARPAMGKSAFALNIATNAAIDKHSKVAIFSLEMSKQEVGNRILASRSDVTTSDLQSAQLSHQQWDNISFVLPTFGTVKMFIDDRSGLTPVEMMAKCRDLKNTEGLDVIFVDYLQLMKASTKSNSFNRQQEISDISRSLKIMAKELNVPIIALSQLSRDADKRDDHRPVLSDLRDSGAIEQDADMVMFIHRPDYYTSKSDAENSDREPSDKQTAEIIIGKNRQGPTKTVYLKWIGSRTMFIDPPKRDKEHGEPCDNYVGTNNISTIPDDTHIPPPDSRDIPVELSQPDNHYDVQFAREDDIEYSDTSNEDDSYGNGYEQDDGGLF